MNLATTFKRPLLLATGLLVLFMGLGLLQTPPASAAGTNPLVQKCNKTDFLGLVPWYQYLGSDLVSSSDASSGVSTCDVKCFNVVDQQSPNACNNKNSDIPLVLLAIIDDLLRIAGLAAIGFVLFGAFKYVGSQGDPDSTAQAQKTIVNALIGLALAMTAVAIVSFLGNSLG